MTITRQEFLIRARLDHDTLEIWIAEEWIIPTGADPEVVVHRGRPSARPVDPRPAGRPRGQRSRVGVILNLVDQMHGLRKMLADLLESMHQSPDQRRR